MSRRTLLATGVLTLLVTIPLDAQVSQRRLQAEAEFPEGFGMVSGVREMSDGRLMITDALGQMLLWVDIDAGTMEQIGREGQGPEEYRTPDALYALPGDSTLLVDLGNGRLTVLDSDGEFVRTMPIGRQVGEQMIVVMPRGVDGRGRIYFQPMGMMMGRPGSGPPTPPDSGSIVRWDPRSNVMDTLGTVKLQGQNVQTGGGGQNTRVSITSVRMSPLDAWAVAADGRVAVARSPEYRLDWIDGGVLRAGAEVSYQPVRVGRAEKTAYVEGTQRAGINVNMNMNNGVRTMSFGRGGSGTGDPDISGEWPATMPPFLAGAVDVAPNGDAWVARSVRSDAESLFDVFDAHGDLKEQVVLPNGRQLVGFGTGVLYAVYFDEFDLQWLERYPVCRQVGGVESPSVCMP